MIALIKQHWGFGRILRLLFGSYILVVSLMESHYFLAFAGAFFIYQSLVNVSCSGCSTNIESEQKGNIEPIINEKQKN